MSEGLTNTAGPEPHQLRSCHACKSKKTRCDKKRPCSPCIRLSRACTYPPIGPRIRRSKKTIMAEMADRIASLERRLAKATVQEYDDDKGPDTQGSLNDLLVHNDSSSQYFNEILVTQVIGQNKNIKAALAISNTENKTLSSPFDPMGILSSPCLGQQPSMFHPEKAVAIELWSIYLNKVEICIGLKLTHVPTDEVRVYSTIDDPLNAKLEDLAYCFSVYFAASISLEQSDYQTTQLHRYKTGLEQAFAQGDSFNSPTLTGLRALAIYLSALRVHNQGKSIWILNGLAVRIAQSLGLHRDGSKLIHSCFDSELRRRLWWHLIARDSRAGEDYGLDDPNTLISTSDVKPPLNIDDADIYPSMEELPPERTGWTEMTFSLVNIDLAKAMEKLKAAFSTPNRSEKLREDVIQKARTRIQKRLETCNPVTPHQRLTVHCSQFLLQKLDFFTRQQWLLLRQGHSSDTIVTEETLMVALDILESRTFGHDPFLAQFSWAKKAHPQYHVTLYVLWYLCFQPESPHAERAWRAINSIFTQEMSISGGGVKVVVMKALRAKAEALRKNEESRSAESQYDAGYTEMSDQQPMDNTLRFMESFNFDEGVFGDDVPWISWTSLVQGIETDNEAFPRW